jgi:hypothetical protein
MVRVFGRGLRLFRLAVLAFLVYLLAATLAQRLSPQFAVLVLRRGRRRTPRPLRARPR